MNSADESAVVGEVQVGNTVLEAQLHHGPGELLEWPRSTNRQLHARQKAVDRLGLVEIAPSKGNAVLRGAAESFARFCQPVLIAPGDDKVARRV